MSEDIDKILEEEYKKIEVPHGMFSVNYSEFKKRVVFFKFIVIGIIVLTILTVLFFIIQLRLTDEVESFINVFNSKM